MSKSRFIKEIGGDSALLVEVVRNGFNAYTANYGHTIDAHSKRSRASLIHDHMIRMALEILPRPDFQLIISGQRNVFSLRDRFLLQFKKLNPNLTTSNYPTKQAWLLDECGMAPALPGMDTNLPIISIGYVPRRYHDGIEGIFAIQTINHAPSWVHRLDCQDDGDTALPITGIQPTPNDDTNTKKSRIRRPGTRDSDTGTYPRKS